uniref:Uncharacterized protein n=1 Tax=Sparus aurata TaxID=8175 RepID=A0A671YJB6_SPAAU
MSWLFLDWFVPLYLLVSVLVLAGFGACLYFLEPGLQDAHKWTVPKFPWTDQDCRKIVFGNAQSVFVFIVFT